MTPLHLSQIARMTGGRLHGTTEVSSFPWYPTGPALTSGTWMVVVEEGESREVLPVIVRR